MGEEATNQGLLVTSRNWKWKGNRFSHLAPGEKNCPETHVELVACRATRLTLGSFNEFVITCHSVNRRQMQGSWSGAPGQWLHCRCLGGSPAHGQHVGALICVSQRPEEVESLVPGSPPGSTRPGQEPALSAWNTYHGKTQPLSCSRRGSS
jgi:hypothetical protein